MSKTINSKSTKAEILEALEEIKKEKSSLEAQIKKLNQTAKTSNIPVEVVEKIPEKPSEKKPMNPIVQNNITQTIQNLEKLQVSFGSAANNLSEQLITEASSLEELKESVAQELQQLEELHELNSVEEDTLETLIQSYEEAAKNFTEEMTLQ